MYTNYLQAKIHSFPNTQTLWSLYIGICKYIRITKPTQQATLNNGFHRC